MKGKIITGLGSGNSDAPSEVEKPLLPRLRTFWVVYFDHTLNKINEVTISAHEVQVVSTGMLIFTMLDYSDDPAFAQVGQPPVVTRYVRAFKDFTGFGEVFNAGSVN